MCQRARSVLIFLTWHANVPNGVPIFYFDMPSCQKACQFFEFTKFKLLRNAKGNFYTLLLYEKFYIIYTWYCSYTYVLHMKIALYFISILNVILNKSVQNFCFLKLFCSLFKNQNTERPGFYMFLVTRVFLNSPQLKQLNKMNTCELCDLLELWSAWIGHLR